MNLDLGGSPGLVVMGATRGREHKTKHRILDGSFFTLICCKTLFEKTKINSKRGREWPI